MAKGHSTRKSKQREVILEELRKVVNHPTADMVYEMVRKRIPRISLGTVYRNLEVLIEQGEIQKLTSGGALMRFDGNPLEHCHIRCIDCGKVDDLQVEPIISLKESSTINGYEILGHRLDCYGRCPKCRKKQQS